MNSTLPSPAELAGLSQFPDWYPGQDHLFSDVMGWLHSSQRFCCLSVPTGSGKSLIAILTAKLSQRRTIILTATKGLQEQITRDFRSVGLVSVKGQNNFVCASVPELRADEAPCHDGLSCPLRNTGGCPYYEQLSRALNSQIVVTNYAYYLAQTRFSTGLGDIDLLIMDEAHLAFSALESHYKTYIARDETESLGITLPREDTEWSAWQAWATRAVPVVQVEAMSVSEEVSGFTGSGRPVPSALARRNRTLKSLVRKLSTVSGASGKWIAEPESHGWLFTPVWVSQYTPALVRDTEKVLLMSAILTPKTVDALGITDRKFISSGSYFPSENTPVYHIPTARVNYRIDDYGSTIWCARIDQIIQRRLDRKGIVFTVSYKRRDLLLQRSRFLNIMLPHGTRDVIEVVNRFKRMSPPAVLVSPAVTSGWDFPGETCLVPGTLVRTSRGYKPIEEIKIGDLVFTHRGRFRKVLATQYRHFSGVLCSMRVGGGIAHKITPEHPVYISNSIGHKRLDSDWVCAGELMPNNKLILPTGGRYLRAKPLSRTFISGHKKASGKRVPNHWNDTTNFWKLVGIWAAEGSISKENSNRKSCGHPRVHRSIEFDFNIDEVDTLVAETRYLIHKVLGNKYPAVYRDTKKAACRIIIKNDAFALWLEKNVGKGAHNKRVPQRLMDCGDTDKMRAFVYGLLEGDGHLNDKQWYMVSASRSLCWDTRDLLLRCGIVAHVGEKTINNKTYYKLNTTSGKVRYRIGESSRSGTWLNSDLSVISEYYNGIVYNLKVADDESYCLTDVCVHNCEYIIIGKVPYPDTSDPVMQARHEDDKEWTSFLAMETLVQEAGRGTRSMSDKCEVLVVDDSWRWFWARYRNMAPGWFQERVLGSLDTVPEPLVGIKTG